MNSAEFKSKLARSIQQFSRDEESERTLRLAVLWVVEIDEIFKHERVLHDDIQVHYEIAHDNKKLKQKQLRVFLRRKSANPTDTLSVQLSKLALNVEAAPFVPQKLAQQNTVQNKCDDKKAVPENEVKANGDATTTKPNSKASTPSKPAPPSKPQANGTPTKRTPTRSTAAARRMIGHALGIRELTKR